ncbi:MAG: D-2-hydroxyacid dehydrogenase, partial [Clostridiales bacterium]|nr:D-2-hydroxyacid dehydrogenase [Clostridiales bacterium]
ANALRNGSLAGYAADVISREPMLPDNPLIGCPNLVLTPHIAWAPMETRKRLIDVAADNLKAFRDGKMLNRIV